MPGVPCGHCYANPQLGQAKHNLKKARLAADQTNNNRCHPRPRVRRAGLNALSPQRYDISSIYGEGDIEELIIEEQARSLDTMFFGGGREGLIFFPTFFP